MRKPHQLMLPEAHTSVYNKLFFYRSSLVWNTLPAAIQYITCNQTFRKEIEKNWSACTHELNPMGAVRIRHSIRESATQPVILWILLCGKPKWLPLNFGFNDVMRTAPIQSDLEN